MIFHSYVSLPEGRFSYYPRMILQLKIRFHFWTAVFECPITLTWTSLQLVHWFTWISIISYFSWKIIFSRYFLGFLYSTDSLPCVDGHSPVECLDSMWRKQCLLVCGFHPFISIISIISIPWKTVIQSFFKKHMLDFYTRFSWGNSRRIALVRILVSFGLRPGIHGEIFQKTLHALMKSPGNPQEIPMKSIKLMPSEDMRSCFFSLEVDGYTTWPPRRRSEDHTIQTAKEEMPLSVWYRTLDEIIGEIILSYNIYYLIYWYLLGNMNDGILQSAK